MYPEWIQEQLDKIAESRKALDSETTLDSLRVQLGAAESRIIHTLHQRLDRIEAKLDRLIDFCEGR